MMTHRPRHHIRLAHRGEHLATTRYVVLPSGVVMLAGTYTVARVAREAAISEALALNARYPALPAVKVPKPYPAATVFAPPLARDRRTARQQPAGPAGTREARKRPIATWHSEAGRSLLAAADRCARRERAQAGRRRA